MSMNGRVGFSANIEEVRSLLRHLNKSYLASKPDRNTLRLHATLLRAVNRFDSQPVAPARLRHKHSLAVRERARQLRRDKYSYSEIARDIGVSAYTVHNWFRRGGFLSDFEHAEAAE